MADTSLVELSDVHVSIAGTSILKGINWTIEPGQSWVLLGPNGAGKTTLTALLTGNLEPSQGQALVFGRPATDIDAQDLNTRVGYAGQALGKRLTGSDSVLKVVLPGAWGQAKGYREEYEDQDLDRAHDLLTAFNLAHLADRAYGYLSEGEQKRVCLARAFMSDPELLILDEPTAGLDLGARELLVSALEEVMGDVRAPATVMITHEIEDIAPSFSHAALLKNGRMRVSGQVEEVFTEANLSDLFDMPLSLTREQGRWWAIATY